jgi:hypothetical protein
VEDTCVRTSDINFFSLKDRLIHFTSSLQISCNIYIFRYLCHKFIQHQCVHHLKMVKQTKMFVFHRTCPKPCVERFPTICHHAFGDIFYGDPAESEQCITVPCFLKCKTRKRMTGVTKLFRSLNFVVSNIQPYEKRIGWALRMYPISPAPRSMPPSVLRVIDCAKRIQADFDELLCRDVIDAIEFIFDNCSISLPPKLERIFQENPTVLTEDDKKLYVKLLYCFMLLSKRQPDDFQPGIIFWGAPQAGTRLMVDTIPRLTNANEQVSFKQGVGKQALRKPNTRILSLVGVQWNHFTSLRQFMAASFEAGRFCASVYGGKRLNPIVHVVASTEDDMGDLLSANEKSYMRRRAVLVHCTRPLEKDYVLTSGALKYNLYLIVRDAQDRFKHISSYLEAEMGILPAMNMCYMKQFEVIC